MAATRRQAREWAIQMLTAADLNPPMDRAQFLQSFWEQLGTVDAAEGGVADAGNLRDFAEERVLGVLNHLDEIDALLKPLLENWDITRLGTVERAVLRLGVWEMKWSEVPKPVVINEAIDLANWFSTPKSRPLVNGVLDKFAKQVGRQKV